MVRDAHILFFPRYGQRRIRLVTSRLAISTLPVLRTGHVIITVGQGKKSGIQGKSTWQGRACETAGTELLIGSKRFIDWSRLQPGVINFVIALLGH